MKMFYLFPKASATLSKEQEALLSQHMEIIYDDEPKPIPDVKGITDPGEKIITLSPLFSGWKVTNDIWDAIPDIKAICLTSTAYSWVDLAYFASKNIPVFNIKGYSTISVAEWAVMSAFMLYRKLPLVIKSGWKNDAAEFRGKELSGKTVGIIGLGSIGKKIAEDLSGMGLNVQYWSKNTRDDRFTFAETSDICKNADIIFPTFALTEESKLLISDQDVQNLKPSTIFVSILHDLPYHETLIEMVKSGRLYGYAFDDANKKLEDYEGNIFVTPPLAWSTDESRKNLIETLVMNAKNAATGNFEDRLN